MTQIQTQEIISLFPNYNSLTFAIKKTFLIKIKIEIQIKN